MYKESDFMSRQKNISGRDTVCGGRRVRRAAAAIIPLIFLSLFLSAFTVSAANDMYAFVKPEASLTLAVESEDSVFSVAKRLEEKGIINNPLIFSVYVKSKGAEEKILGLTGEVTLNASMSYREIVSAFSKKQRIK